MYEAKKSRDKAGGWILHEGDKPVGTGPSMHAALADGRRRTGGPETHRSRLAPATSDEMLAVASMLGPGGLTAAEAAWCAGTMNSIPVYRRSVDYAENVLAVAERLGGARDKLTIQFDDGSRLELVQLREELGHRDLIRLVPKEEWVVRSTNRSAGHAIPATIHRHGARDERCRHHLEAEPTGHREHRAVTTPQGSG